MNAIPCHCAKDASFDRYELSAGLLAKRCANCRGVLLSMNDYLDWRERHFSDALAAVEPAAIPGQEKASKAHACSQCSRVMARYRTGGASSFWLDYCPSCQLVWLDDGEWALLEQSGLALHLDTILTDRWQQRIQSRKTLSYREELLRTRFGEETLSEIRRIQAWLNAHPKKRDILAWLGENIQTDKA
jgi:Zn-finger nucleic acid-binding protein